jgi:hypothetical protein
MNLSINNRILLLTVYDNTTTFLLHGYFLGGFGDDVGFVALLSLFNHPLLKSIANFLKFSFNFVPASPIVFFIACVPCDVFEAVDPMESAAKPEDANPDAKPDVSPEGIPREDSPDGWGGGSGAMEPMRDGIVAFILEIRESSKSRSGCCSVFFTPYSSIRG